MKIMLNAYEKAITDPTCTEVGPGIIQTGERAFVVDITKAAPAYLAAVGLDRTVGGMEIVRQLITRDVNDFAGDGGQLRIHYPKVAGCEQFSDKFLETQADPDENVNEMLFNLDVYAKKLQSARVKRAMASSRRIEV